jgi:DNA-binding CsgD family transcriptional regulator
LIARTAVPEGVPGLFDRDREVAAMDVALARARRGDASVLILRGPAGIGKSSLLAAAQRQAGRAGMTVLRARAAPVERTFPYGVVRQLFEPMFASALIDVADLFAGAAARARSVLSDQPDASVTGDASLASLHALYWLTANVAAFAPLLICVDDLVWCDEASLRFLEFVVRRLAGMPVLLTLAYRTGEPGCPDAVDALAGDPLAEVLAPSPLSRSGAAQMVKDVLGEAPDRDFGNACQVATGGNPLLLVELLRALAAEDVRPRSEELGRVREIGSIAVGPAVKRRLSSLGPSALDVAQAMAVLGESARRADLARMTGIDEVELEAVVLGLARARVVASGEGLGFAHPLVADAVRASLSPAVRSRLHRDAAQALRARAASPWELAPHLLQSPQQSHPDASRLLREAAAWALAAGACEAAVTYLERAVCEDGADEDAAPLLVELGVAKAKAGDETASDDLERAMSLSVDARTRGRARAELAQVLFTRGEFLRCMTLLEDGIVEVEDEDPELARRLEAQLLVCAHYGDQLTLTSPWINERIARARSSQGLSSTPAGRLVLCSLALEEVIGGGSAATAVALADQALSGEDVLRDEGPESLPFYSAMFALIWCDELDRAAALLGRALAESRERVSVVGFAYASSWRAYANLRRGRLLDAEADGRAALEAARQHVPGHVELAAAFLAATLTARGRLSEAEAILGEAHVPEQPISGAFMLLESRSLLRLAGDEDSSAMDDLERYAQLEHSARDVLAWRRPVLTVLPHRSLRAELLHRAGDVSGARELIEEEVRLAHVLGTPRAIGMTRRVAGLLQRGDAQIELLRSATDELAKSQSRLEYAVALCDYGAALRRSNRRADARAPLKAALAIARQAGAGALQQRAGDELKATGARVSRPHAWGRDALTASELRIASMAANGISNRDIAQARFITIKTVESHLGHVYQKLNISMRTELRAALDTPDVPSDEQLDAQLVGR